MDHNMLPMIIQEIIDLLVSDDRIHVLMPFWISFHESVCREWNPKASRRVRCIGDHMKWI